MGHLGESHLAPFRYSFIFSRRQSLQSAPVYRAICQYSSDPAPLRRPAAVVRNGRDVLDRPDLQAGRLQGPDGGLPPRAWALDEHVNLAHPVLHGPPRRGLGRHLRGERGRLARSLETDLAGRRPGDDVADRVGDGDDGVVERAPDVGVPVGDVLAFLAAYLLGGAGAALRRHLLPVRWRSSVRGGCAGRRELLLPGLLLAGHGLLPALAGPGVGLRALAVHGQPSPVADALVAPDLHLAPDVGLHLTAQVSFDPVGGLDPVAELDHVIIGEVVNPDVAADAGGLQRLERTGAPDSIDVRESDLKALVAREVNTNQSCHLRAALLLLGRSGPPRPTPARVGPGLLPGVPLPGLGPVRVRCARLRRQPWRCLCRGSVQITMTRPCRRMIRHLLQIFFTLGLTFNVLSSGAGAIPGADRFELSG